MAWSKRSTLIAAIGFASFAGAASAQDDCRQRAYAAMDRGLLSIRTEGRLLVAVVAPSLWPASDRVAQERLINDLDCAMNNPGVTGQFAVIDEMSGEPLAMKTAGVIAFPE